MSFVRLPRRFASDMCAMPPASHAQCRVPPGCPLHQPHGQPRPATLEMCVPDRRLRRAARYSSVAVVQAHAQATRHTVAVLPTVAEGCSVSSSSHKIHAHLRSPSFGGKLRWTPYTGCCSAPACHSIRSRHYSSHPPDGLSMARCSGPPRHCPEATLHTGNTTTFSPAANVIAFSTGVPTGNETVDQTMRGA